MRHIARAARRGMLATALGAKKSVGDKRSGDDIAAHRRRVVSKR